MYHQMHVQLFIASRNNNMQHEVYCENLVFAIIFLQACCNTALRAQYALPIESTATMAMWQN